MREKRAWKRFCCKQSGYRTLAVRSDQAGLRLARRGYSGGFRKDGERHGRSAKAAGRKAGGFAGQSAVGKTSLINRLCGLSLRVGDLSEKTCRGRHTTTYSSIYQAGNCRIADTPGFAVLEADLSADEIKDYYEDFIEYAADCRFRGCTHTAEPGCAVKKKWKKKSYPRDDTRDIAEFCRTKGEKT